jgi:hypothetical protein
MKKNDQLIFAALLAAFFVVLSMTLSVLMPTTVEISGKIDSELPAVQTVQPVAPPTTQAPVTVPATTQPAETQPTDKADEVTTAPAEENTNDSAIPQGNEEILAKYTELMNDAKSKAVGFKKVEWQAIPEEKAQFEGSMFNKILPLASNFFKTEEAAKAEPEIVAKGGDMEWFPIYHNTKGCMLTDTSAIKNATCTELPDGNVKIVIALNDEFNSEPPVDAPTCDSYIGSMFTPIQFAEVRNTLENDSTIKFIIKDVDFELTYYDCVAELTYNPETNQIVELQQFMHIDINIKNGTLLGMSAKGRAVLDNSMYISEFVY